MTNGFDEMILNMTDTTPEPEDYTGEDGLLYCGKCHKPKEGYFPKETAAWLGHDRHPAECDCQRAEREEREAAEKQRSHLETVERLKRRGFTDPAMQGWTFENDNGKCPQMEHAHFYVENWETMKERNIGYIRFHDLRHTAATNMHQLTGDFYTVGEVLGHTLAGIGVSLGLSMNFEAVTARYVDVRLERKKEVLDAYHGAVKQADPAKAKEAEPKKAKSAAKKKSSEIEL